MRKGLPDYQQAMDYLNNKRIDHRGSFRNLEDKELRLWAWYQLFKKDPSRLEHYQDYWFSYLNYAFCLSPLHTRPEIRIVHDENIGRRMTLVSEDPLFRSYHGKSFLIECAFRNNRGSVLYQSYETPTLLFYKSDFQKEALSREAGRPRKNPPLPHL